MERVIPGDLEAKMDSDTQLLFHVLYTNGMETRQAASLCIAVSLLARSLTVLLCMYRFSLPLDEHLKHWCMISKFKRTDVGTTLTFSFLSFVNKPFILFINFLK